jgi:hypothetical protein
MAEGRTPKVFPKGPEQEAEGNEGGMSGVGGDRESRREVFYPD